MNEFLQQQIDNHEDVVFFRPNPRGRVHIYIGKCDIVGNPPKDVVESLMAHNHGLCGAIGRIAQLDYVSTFADEDLCMRCRGLYPEEHSNRLYEHPVSNDE